MCAVPARRFDTMGPYKADADCFEFTDLVFPVNATVSVVATDSYSLNVPLGLSAIERLTISSPDNTICPKKIFGKCKHP